MARRLGHNFVAEVDRLMTELRLVGPKGALDRIRPAQNFTLKDATEALKAKNPQVQFWMQQTPVTAPSPSLFSRADVVGSTRGTEGDAGPKRRGRSRRTDEPVAEINQVWDEVESDVRRGKTTKRAARDVVLAAELVVTEEDLREVRKEGSAKLGPSE